MIAARENRVFARSTMVLAGLLVLGLVGLGGFFGLRWLRGGESAPLPALTKTPLALSTPTPTRALVPTATPTLVVVAATTPTPTASQATPTAAPSGGGALPATGWGGFDSLLLGVGLVMVMIAARLARGRTS
jgi:hypothetical protein